MAKKSIGSLHLEVTANAQGFISELKRADNQARVTSSAIDKEVDKLTKSVKKKFDLADFGKDVLKGAGLFGGFSILNTGMDYFVGKWREGEAYAARVDESAKSIADKFREIASLRIESKIDSLLPQDQLAARKRQLEEISGKLAGLESARSNAMAGAAFVNQNGQGALGVSNFAMRVKTFSGEKFGGDTGMGGRDFYELMLDRADAAQAAMPALQKQAEALKKNISDLSAASVNNALTDFFGDLDAQSATLKDLTKATADFGEVEDFASRQTIAMADAQALANKRFEEAAALTLSVLTPLEKYTAAIERINDMETRGSITTETAARAIGEAGAAYSKASEEVEDFASRLAKADAEQNKSVVRMDSWSSGMAQMWENVADRAGQSFADILISGENTFGNLVNIVARSVIEMAARLAIINPLMNSLFGLSGAAVLPALFGVGASVPGRARGGGVEGGVTYRVNEQGQEFFKSNTGGTIIPAGIASGMTGSKAPSSTYYIDATGADAGKIAQLENMIRAIGGSVESRAVGAVIAAKRRGGGMAAALA